MSVHGRLARVFSRVLTTTRTIRNPQRPIRRITTAANSEGRFQTDIAAYSSITHAVTPLNSYGLIKVSGVHSAKFLQGLVTNDVTDASHDSTYNAILAPTGRYLYDCFVSKLHDDYYIEADIEMIGELMQYLKKYKLRSKVSIENLSDHYRIWSLLVAPKSVHSTFAYLADKYQHGTEHERLCYIDPRYDALGIRMVLKKTEIPHQIPPQFVPVGEDFYNTLKCVYGIPTHGLDLIPEKSIILESNFSYLNGVSFTKGCYIGQELIARTQYRGQIRKRLFGASIMQSDGSAQMNNNAAVKRMENLTDNRDTVIPNEVVQIAQFGEDNETAYDDRDIVNVQSKKVVGKVMSNRYGLNCCMVQLRNTAFTDIQDDDAKTVGLQIADSNVQIIPHYPDYFTSFSELFAAKE